MSVCQRSRQNLILMYFLLQDQLKVIDTDLTQGDKKMQYQFAKFDEVEAASQ